jgi:hypothetical protein
MDDGCSTSFDRPTPASGRSHLRRAFAAFSKRSNQAERVLFAEDRRLHPERLRISADDSTGATAEDLDPLDLARALNAI